MALRAVGLTVVHEPVLTRRVVDDCAAVVSKLGADDWLVLTSPYAIEAVAAEPARVPNTAVVGEPSRRAALARGLRVQLVSSRGAGQSLFDELRARVKSGTVCYPRSSLAKAPPAWSGVEILSPVLYETVSRDFDRSVIERVDVIAVTSPSAVEALGVADGSPLREASRASLRDLSIASIGPTTSAALRQAGIEPAIEAPQRSFDSLARAIADYDPDSRHQRA